MNTLNLNTKFYLFMVIAFLLSYSVNAQGFQYLSSFNSLGVPTVKLFETVPTTLLNNVTSSLPESQPVPTYRPEYIANGITTDIKLQGNAGDTADVWVTFIKEGAGYKNVLGFYTYPLSNPPTTAPANSNITIIFPNVSFYNSGGGLYTGDKIHLGRFPMNTGIGFVLLANAFNSSTSTVGSGLWRLFSNPNFNPEATASLRNHIVLLNDTVHNKIIFGFEDIRRDYSNCDQDFNDAIFYVTANPMSAINRTGMNYASQSPLNPPVTSGSTGGLESNGTLASLISHRNYQKTVYPEMFVAQHSHLRTSSALSSYFPDLQNRYQTQEVTPTDLLTITNAQEIAAIDYFEGQNRVASIFATQTPNFVYDHSKVICDRLNGAELLDIEEITLYDVPFILSHFKNAEGNYEYAISYSVANEAENRVYSRWVTEQYPKKAIYENFQIWGGSRMLCEEIAYELIANIKKEKVLTFDTQAVAYIPPSFVSKGQYEKGKLVLTTINRLGAESLEISGLVRKSEDMPQEAWSEVVSTEQQFFLKMEVEVGNLFDIGLKLRSSASTASDVLYLADGAWGLDYEKNGKTEVETFEIVPQNEITKNDNEWQVERNVKLVAKTSDYLSVFRLLKPSAKAIDLSAFNALEFDAVGNAPIQITLVKKGINDFKAQYKTTVYLQEGVSHYAVSFSEFSNLSSQLFDASDINSIILTSTANGTEKVINWDLSNFKFTKNGKTYFEDLSKGFSLAPNPVTDGCTLSFQVKKACEVSISIKNAMGQTVQESQKSCNAGVNKTWISTEELGEGIFFMSITDQTSFLQTVKFLHKN
jgi:hypothetical protein